MRTTKTQKFMLYTLGKWYEEANKKIKEAALEVAISKVSFIELVRAAEIAEKHERTLYRNLEVLEKKKWAVYKNKEIMLTARGRRMFERIKKDVEPYVRVTEKLMAKDPTSYTRRVQTVFR